MDTINGFREREAKAAEREAKNAAREAEAKRLKKEARRKEKAASEAQEGEQDEVGMVSQSFSSSCHPGLRAPWCLRSSVVRKCWLWWLTV